MKTRTLGQTDLTLTPIALGTWGLAEGSYGDVDPAVFEETVKTALDRGIRTFDCAPLWGDGESERRVGAALAARDEEAEESTVITRGGVRRTDDGTLERAFDPEDLRKDAEGSLERLKREALDVWLLHNPGRDVLLRDDWRELVDDLLAEGKVRTWGVSVGTLEEARLALSAGAHALCLPHNLLSTELLTELGPELDEAGAGVLVRSPLCYGLLGGQWSEHRRASRRATTGAAAGTPTRCGSACGKSGSCGSSWGRGTATSRRRRCASSSPRGASRASSWAAETPTRRSSRRGRRRSRECSMRRSSAVSRRCGTRPGFEVYNARHAHTPAPLWTGSPARGLPQCLRRCPLR